MKVNMLKGKIHRATVVQAELNYVGSITVDEDLLDAAGKYECVPYGRSHYQCCAGKTDEYFAV